MSWHNAHFDGLDLDQKDWISIFRLATNNATIHALFETEHYSPFQRRSGTEAKRLLYLSRSRLSILPSSSGIGVREHSSTKPPTLRSFAEFEVIS
jgi:hypothetical protein